jgi:hypothetical protein
MMGYCTTEAVKKLVNQSNPNLVRFYREHKQVLEPYRENLFMGLSEVPAGLISSSSYTLNFSTS